MIGVLGSIDQFALAEVDAAVVACAKSLRRRCLDRRLVVLEQVGVGRETIAIQTTEGVVEQVRLEVEIAARIFVAQKTANSPQVTVVEPTAARQCRLHSRRVERLLVLSKACIADETLLIEDDALSSDARTRPVGLKAQVRLIDLSVFGIGDDAVVGLTIGRAVVLLCADRVHVFAFEQHAKAILRIALEARARA